MDLCRLLRGSSMHTDDASGKKQQNLRPGFTQTNPGVPLSLSVWIRCANLSNPLLHRFPLSLAREEGLPRSLLGVDFWLVVLLYHRPQVPTPKDTKIMWRSAVWSCCPVVLHAGLCFSLLLPWPLSPLPHPHLSILDLHSPPEQRRSELPVVCEWQSEEPR